MDDTQLLGGISDSKAFGRLRSYRGMRLDRSVNRRKHSLASTASLVVNLRLLLEGHGHVTVIKSI